MTSSRVFGAHQLFCPLLSCIHNLTKIKQVALNLRKLSFFLETLMVDAFSESGMKVRHCAAAVSLPLFFKNSTKFTLISVQGVRNLQRQDLCLKLLRCFVNKVGGIHIYSNKTMPNTRNIFSSRERLLEIDGLE